MSNLKVFCFKLFMLFLALINLAGCFFGANKYVFDFLNASNWNMVFIFLWSALSAYWARDIYLDLKKDF